MMLKVMAKWSEFTIHFWDETFKLLMISSELDRTRSKRLPLICVGSCTSCTRLLSNTKSQKVGEAADNDSQLMSGRLKSPTIIISDGVNEVNRSAN